MKRERVPEPWMFGTEVTIDGQPVQGQIMRFTRMARLRRAYRRVLGLPEFRGIQISDGDKD